MEGMASPGAAEHLPARLRTGEEVTMGLLAGAHVAHLPCSNLTIKNGIVSSEDSSMRSTMPAAFAAMASLSVAWNVCAAQDGHRPVRPKGTFVRPADGVRTPSLDKAWEEYAAALQSASDAVRAVMEERHAAAKEKGLFDGLKREEAQLKT